MSDSQPMHRRDFLRAIGIGVMGGGAGILLTQAVLAGQCISDGKCRTCVAYDGCELPEKQVINVDELDNRDTRMRPTDRLSEEAS